MTSTTTLDIRSIKEILPHRYPALLLDKVLQIDPRKYIVGIKNVTINEPIFQGHFDDAPILPGVLILESLLQTGATLFLQDPEYYGRYAFFASIKEAEFLQKVICFIKNTEIS